MHGPRTPARFLVLAYCTVIAAGTAVLATPLAQAGAGESDLLAAFFTAASAGTVTGLTVVDTPSFWTPLGHVAILVLVQIGGLGIMSSASLLGLLTLRRFGLRTWLTATAETRSIDLGDVRTVVGRVAAISFAVEGAIAVVLAVRLARAYDMDPLRALWHGVFHGVSAFNNAGFALYSDSLARFGTDPWVLVPVAVGVLLGGFGFPVLFELSRELRRPRAWSLNTVLVLWGTAVLVPAGWVLITALEWTNPQTFGPYSTGRTIGTGAFEALMPRSAGFSTVDWADVSPATLLVGDVLMFIGAGSGGTGGGIKITTFAVLFFVIYAEARGESAVNAFGRRLPRSVHRQAISVALLAIGAVISATLAMIVLSEASMERALFEVISAATTTGLSTGLSAEAPVPAQLLLAVVMLLGRIGPITVATALALRRRTRLYELPEERPVIG
ncbi:Trk-type K+ transport system, membrane component [Quadrisphaera sp. DSM 44207]|nr:Trk-type K+ transport system, membrane component [Quadrisphaera sp. DSM 44207]